jgi:hypothetical protein
MHLRRLQPLAQACETHEYSALAALVCLVSRATVWSCQQRYGMAIWSCLVSSARGQFCQQRYGAVLSTAVLLAHKMGKRLPPVEVHRIASLIRGCRCAQLLGSFIVDKECHTSMGIAFVCATYHALSRCWYDGCYWAMQLLLMLEFLQFELNCLTMRNAILMFIVWQCE